ncbi:MAG: hypothetical protein ACTHJJ_12845 [Intrasporangium sp.]|uniref:hypothetical protein n=1 Tax=Intrasporangium sp. TaxID=1925024 RepID=UPI003F7DDB8E
MNDVDLQGISLRIQRLLDEFEAAGDPVAQARAEALVSTLMELYAAGLARIAELAEAHGALRALADDELVSGLLLLHDLHPDDVDRRIRGALSGLRGQLGAVADDVDYLGVDEAGVARFAFVASGCASTAATVTGAVEAAVLAAAPEIVSVDVAAERRQPVLQIGLRPGLQPRAATREGAPSS